MYDYYEAIHDDTMNAITENYTAEEIAEALKEDREAFEEKLNDELWIDDAVTGNGSGSYTFSTYEAEENLAHNWALLEEAAEAYGYEEPHIATGWEFGAEWWDVTIRCYLLSEAISDCLDELENADE